MSDDGAPRAPRVAIAHDYITQRGGAERVVLALTRAFPEATVYTTLYNPKTTYPEFRDVDIVTSPLNRVPFLRGHHRAALPLLTWACNRMNVESDVIVASSSGWAHGFAGEGKRLVYCHSPARWLYLSDEYLGAKSKSSTTSYALKLLKPLLLPWDQRAAEHADRYLANSRVIAERIHRVYGIDADVLAPPFGVSPGGGETAPIPQVSDWVEGSYYLIVSRLMPYKNIEHAIEAVRGTGRRLLVVGAGPLDAELRGALPDNVRIVADISDRELRWAYKHSRALIAPSFEDFGLTPLEAGVFARPVAALRAGGYLDTVIEGRTGVFFDRPDPDQIAAALDELDATAWDHDFIAEHAAGFCEDRFVERLRSMVSELAAPNQEVPSRG